MENRVEIKELFDALYLCEGELTPGQTDFIRGAKKQFHKTKELSDRQISVLREIKRFLPSEEVRFSGAFLRTK